MKDLVEEANEANQEQATSGLLKEVFSLYWLFKEQGLDDPQGKAEEMASTMDRYPHWKTSAEHQRQFKRELYRILIKSGQSVAAATELVDRTMRSLQG